MDGNVFDFEDDLAVCAKASRDEVSDDFLLAVDSDTAAAGEFEHIDAMAAVIEAKFESMMYEAFAPHAFANACFIEEIDGALFENACADALFDVVAAASFQNDRFNSLKMQKVREE